MQMVEELKLISFDASSSAKLIALGKEDNFPLAF